MVWGGRTPRAVHWHSVTLNPTEKEANTLLTSARPETDPSRATC